jgi:hypothetical protein
MGRRTEMLGEVRQMLHVDQNVQQVLLRHPFDDFRVQALRGFRYFSLRTGAVPVCPWVQS